MVNFSEFLRSRYTVSCYYLLCSITALVFAYFGQYVLGWKPCILCIYERIPHAIVIIISIANILFPNRLLYWLILLSLSCLILLAGYHAGVDFRIFEAPSFCSSTIFAGNSVEDMQSVLQSVELLSCDKSAVWIMGLSLAGWHFIYSIVELVSGIYINTKYGKKHTTTNKWI